MRSTAVGKEEPDEWGTAERVEAAEDGGVGGHAVPELAGESGAGERRHVGEPEEDLTKEVNAEGGYRRSRRGLRPLGVSAAGSLGHFPHTTPDARVRELDAWIGAKIYKRSIFVIISAKIFWVGADAKK